MQTQSSNAKTTETTIAPLEHFDVLIVGAGFSGIGAGYRLQTECPGKTYAILESRNAMGGTWDLFRYPGIRSDSDMYTLGFAFRPWREKKSIAGGASIVNYIRETASEYGIDQKIRYGHTVTRASWSSPHAEWTVDATGPEGKPLRFTCNFLYMCSGYYDYAQGYLPGWPQMDRYRGRIVHPQHWPEDLDVAGQRIVVIGSGATAVTLVPALARTAAHVTMLQRSPSYIVARPSEDPIAKWMNGRLPESLAGKLLRWKNVLLGTYFYNFARKKPERTKKMIFQYVSKFLGPEYDAAKHFTPRYNPWDQRLCLIPDADLLVAIRAGKASIVTDEIETFTERGLHLKSGEELPADIIVTATGLNIKLLGGIRMTVDGANINPVQSLSYKGMMYSDIPNFASAFGYTNASWTLKSDLTAQYMCRLLNYMQSRDYDYCTPRRRDPSIAEEPAITLNSGYLQRSNDLLPKQGSKKPWRLHQNYARDLLALKLGRINDGTMEFTRLERKQRSA
jgi:cation diffusion facilitator CzcD-associated flavoprotein CzcO